MGREEMEEIYIYMPQRQENNLQWSEKKLLS